MLDRSPSSMKSTSKILWSLSVPLQSENWSSGGNAHGDQVEMVPKIT